MFLKSMEIFGFKSFMNKTQMIFEPGITVIVGPNGCGKSNIVDSVRWVLGERHARSIRGERMEDVIFNGTEQRKPLSIADVSITIDNSNKILDIDSNSITVNRRVFRDGESEYLINKSPVRLKDIERLFLDTGIGKSAYSVIEQGKIDLILSSKAEDRRYIFEEAAGISRFKLQKKESEKKLMDTSNNLDRINDIINEIEREKEIKARQAEKTTEYLSLKSRTIDYDIRLNLLKYMDLNKKREKNLYEIEELRQKRESISAKISRISAENEWDERQKNDIQLQLFQLDKEFYVYQIKLEDIDSKKERNSSLIEEQYNRKESLERKLEEGNKGLDRLKGEKSSNEQAGIIIQRELEEERKVLRDLEEKRERKIETIKRSRDRIEENKKRIKSLEEKLRQQREVLEEIIRRLLDAIEKRKAELISSEAQRQLVKSRIDDRLSNIDELLNDALMILGSGNIEEAIVYLRRIDMKSLRDDILSFESYEDGFRTIILDKTGIHAEKETIDRMIKDLTSSIDMTRLEITELEESIHNEERELVHINNDVAKIEKDIIRNENEKDWIERHLKSINLQIEDIEGHIGNYRNDILTSERVIESLNGEIDEWERLLVEYNMASEDLKRNISHYTERRSEIESMIFKRNDISKRDTLDQKKIVEKIGEKEKIIVELDFRINSIEEYLWTEYEKKISEFEDISEDSTEYVEIQRNIKKLKDEIQELGPINNLAIEEYKDLQNRANYYLKQREDIENARKDLLSVIGDINRISVEMFTKTLQGIKKNFSEIFKKLFEGGNATIELTDMNNILESGIEIMARPPGKKLKDLNMLSGGERGLTAIALIFATYMIRPSPFYFLDEIDAALDEENIGRFIRLLQQFAQSTQFVVITHNKKTMSIAGTIYGVTMEEPGVSKVVSLKMKKGGETKEKEKRAG